MSLGYTSVPQISAAKKINNLARQIQQEWQIGRFRRNRQQELGVVFALKRVAEGIDTLKTFT